MQSRLKVSHVQPGPGTHINPGMLWQLPATRFPTSHRGKIDGEEVSLKPHSAGHPTVIAASCPAGTAQLECHRQHLDNWGTTTHKKVFFLYLTELFASQPALPCNGIIALVWGNDSFSAGLTTNRNRTCSEQREAFVQQQGIIHRARVQTRLKMSVLERTELEILSQMQQFYCRSFPYKLNHSSSWDKSYDRYK